MTAPPTIPETSGVPVESFDEEPTPRDAPRLAVGSGNERPVTGRVERYDGHELRDRPDNLRLAELETWREDVDGWRLRMSGVGDGNGRLGKMDRRIDEHAAYIAKETARQKKILAGLFTVAIGCGGVIKVVMAAREAAAAKAARIELRIEHLERDLYREKRP